MRSLRAGLPAALLLLSTGPARCEVGTARLFAEAYRSAMAWEPKSCLTEVQFLAGIPPRGEKAPAIDEFHFRFISLRNPRWNLDKEFNVPAGSEDARPEAPQRESSHRPYSKCLPEPDRLMDNFDILRLASQRGFEPASRMRMQLLVVDDKLPMFSAELFRNLDGAPIWMLDGKKEAWAADARDGKLYLRVPMEDPEAAAKMPDYPETKLGAPEATAPNPGLKPLAGSAAPAPCRVSPREADELKGNAGCWIWVGDNIVALKRRVRDTNGRLRTVLDFPGGIAAKGERAQCAAHRRTAEDLGLDVEVGKLIRVFKGEYHLYECRLDPADAKAERLRVPKGRSGEILAIMLQSPSALEGGDIWSTR